MSWKEKERKKKMVEEYTPRRKKKEWLENLYYKIGRQKYDFYLCGTYEKDGEKLFTKWKKFSECILPIDFDGTSDDWKVQKFFDGINQRQILPIEIVLDIEEKKQIKPIVKQLEKWKWEYSIWETGSRGYHIHIFVDEELSKEEKAKIIKTFGTDPQKDSEKTLIALGGVPHWKTGKIKREITKEEILNNER